MRSPVIMIIIYVLLSILVDWYILTKTRHASKSIKTFVIVETILLDILLIIALSLTARGDESVLLAKMWCLFAWLTFFAIKALYAVFALIGSIPAIWGGRRIKSGKWVGLPLGICACVLLWTGAFHTRRQIEVMPVAVVSQKIPSAFSGFTIAQISDLHLGTWGNDTTFVASLVDSVNAMHPDLIVFTGDLVNRHTPEAYPFASTLSRLKAPYGVIAVLGNHDYGMYYTWRSPQEEQANMDSLYSFYNHIGWKLLNNRHMNITRNGASLALIGVENWGEPPFNKYGDLSEALANNFYPDTRDTIEHNGKTLKILLTHNPEHWKKVVRHESNIDLTLSGHTHGMQMEWRIAGLRISPAVWRYSLWGGLYKNANSPNHSPIYLYVNIGDGSVGLPFRLMDSHPEITLFTLYNHLPAELKTSAAKIAN